MAAMRVTNEFCDLPRCGTGTGVHMNSKFTGEAKNIILYRVPGYVVFL
jgi:hypothetical protein